MITCESFHRKTVKPLFLQKSSHFSVLHLPAAPLPFIKPSEESKLLIGNFPDIQPHVSPLPAVGMKCRGVYETPGGAILYKAHKVLETICLDKETVHYKALVAQKLGELVYNAQWFTPLTKAILSFVKTTQETVTGDVTLKLYKGNMINAGVSSPYSLYDPEIATFDEDEVYNQSDATGFINLYGLPTSVYAKMKAKNGLN